MQQLLTVRVSEVWNIQYSRTVYFRRITLDVNVMFIAAVWASVRDGFRLKHAV